MITTLMNQKRGLHRFSKLPDDGDPLAPNNLLKPGEKEKHQLNPVGPSSISDGQLAHTNKGIISD